MRITGERAVALILAGLCLYVAWAVARPYLTVLFSR
jgi:hypothetical protein